jgi:ABC-2 type transport system ATP-binding protein
LGSPELIILDEPLNGLDPEGILHVREMIRSWAVDKGITFFISSHILAEVEQLCDCVGFVVSGATVAEGSLDELGATGWVQLKVSHTKKADEAITSKWPEIQTVRMKDNTLDFRMDQEKIPELVRLLVDRDLDIYCVHQRPRSLEEIFMELTGKKA